MAISDDYAGIWPVGYPWFIRLIGVVSHSDDLLVFCQLAIYYISGVYFFLYLKKVFTLNSWGWYSIYFVIFLNPLVLLIQNFVLSDGIFISVSLIWITQLFKLGNRHSLRLVFLHALVILVALMIRYHAIIYPVISIVVLCFKNNILLKERFFTVCLISGACAVFFIFSVYSNRRTFGVNSISISGGWQIANNALHVYNRINVPDEMVTELPSKFRLLDNYVQKYALLVKKPAYLSGVYIWNYRYSPLTLFAVDHNDPFNDSISLYKWTAKGMAKVDGLYREYGIFIVENYSWTFFRDFLCVNGVQYFYPDVECLEFSDDKIIKVVDVMKKWFGYTDEQIFVLGGGIFNLSRYFNIVNLFIQLSFIFFYFLFIRISQKRNEKVLGILKIGGVSMVFNFLFLVFLTPVVLRYQIFGLMVLTVLLIILLIEFFQIKLLAFSN